VSPRTQTHPLDDPRMWRRLLARTHPDTGGDGELFIWTGALKDAVCGGELRIARKPSESAPRRSGSAPTHDKPRIPYPTGADFEEVTREAMRVGETSLVYGPVLSLLENCEPLEHIAYEQERRASYKRLAAIAYTWGMSKQERIGWYRVAEEIPLSDRHAGHILSSLKRQAA
jgi:hypothetical protein